MDFDQFMEVVAATGAEPYLVLNYDSANKPSADPADSWGYDKLRDAAESWVAYIVRKGYQVTCPSMGAVPHACLASLALRSRVLMQHEYALSSICCAVGRYLLGTESS